MQIPLNRVVRRAFKEAAAKHGILIEAINGLETIKSVGGESKLQSGWERFVGATAESGNRSRFLSAITVNFAAFTTQLVTVGVVVVGVYRISEGLMTVGALVACTIIAGRAMAPLGPGRRPADPLPPGQDGLRYAQSRHGDADRSGPTRCVISAGRS